MSPRAPALPPDERRAALVAATLPLVREHGAAVSTRQIAQAAGVAEGTIFRVFDSKEDLLRACIGHAFDAEAVRDELRTVDRTLPLQERLTASVELMLRHTEDVFSVLIALRQLSPPSIPLPQRGRPNPRSRLTDQIVEDELLAIIGADADRLRVPAPRLLEYLRMLTLANAHPLMRTSTATAAEIVDVALNGLLDRRHDQTPDHEGESC